MFIEEPESFKVWLTTILKPMCDADPAALAKYIIALVKKDKSTSALRESMVNQLEVFLQGETESFVNLLFKTLDTQEYLTPIIPNTNPPNPHVDIDSSTRITVGTLVPKEPIKPPVVIPASDLPSLSEAINNGTKRDIRDKEEGIQKKDYKKVDTEREEKPLSTSTSSLTSAPLPPNRRRSRHRSTSRERIRNTSRSRSRSWDRCRRPNSRSPPSQSIAEQSNSVPPVKPPISSSSSVASSSVHHHQSVRSSHDKGSTGDKISSDRRDSEYNSGSRRGGGDRASGNTGRSGTWRNKSPPSRRYGGMDRRGRGGSGSPGRKSRSRSPVRHGNSYRGNRYRNRSPPPHGQAPPQSRLSRSRSRERPLPPLLSSGPPPSAAAVIATPAQDSSHGDMDLRLSNSAQSLQSAAVVAAAAAVAANAIVAPPGTTAVLGKRRCRDYDEKGYCMRGEMCPYDHGIDPVVVEDTTLSQVLAYTSSTTAQAQSNGGPQQVVLPPLDGPPPPPGHLGPHHPHILSRLPPPPMGTAPPEYNPQAPQIWRGPPQMITGPPPILSQMGVGPYGPPPCPPGSLPPPPTNQPPPPHQQQQQQRELISIPTTLDAQLHKLPPHHHHHPPPDQHQHQLHMNSLHHFNQHHHQMNAQHGGRPPYISGMFKRKTFDYNRLGPRRLGGGPGGGAAGGGFNCALELKKVPVGLNNITHLNKHFEKFGKIVNIQVSFEGDPEAAIVTFSSYAEANAAYRSTEAVLNNRFIKVFWHSPEGKVPSVPGPGLPVAEKENNLLQAQEEKKEGGAEQQKEQHTVAVAAIKRGQELLAAKEKLKKNQEEKRREAVKLTQDLRKRKQELLEKQLAQQKLLIDKMEKTGSGVQRDKLLETIKKSQESIEAIRKDMLSQPTAPAPKPTPIQIAKSREEVQKEMLDAELDLITKQQEGVDTTDVQKRLMALQARQRQLMLMKTGFAKTPKRYNPIQVNRTLLTKNNLIGDPNNLLKGNVKSINAKSAPNNHLQAQQKHAVDHRPTRVLVSGYESDEIDSVLTHFGQFGEISEHHSDPSTPHVILNYRSRKEAEQALTRGKHFQDRTLSVTWCLTPVAIHTTQTLNNNSAITPTTATTVIQSSTVANAATLRKKRLSSSGGSIKSRTVLLSTTESDDDLLLDGSCSVLDEGALLSLDEDRMLLDGGKPGKGRKPGADGEDELGVEISEEVLLQDDEEEDEENEDRSWRR